MQHSVSNFTNLPELSSHDGDEDLIELGRKFADALERQEKHHLDDARGIDKEMKAYTLAVDDADRIAIESHKVRATTLIGLRLKAWCALYMLDAYSDSDDTPRVIRSLLCDLVPNAQQKIPGCRFEEDEAA